MTEIRYYCDGCKKEVSNIDDLQPIELPRMYEYIDKCGGGMLFKSHKVGLKHYDFCTDCWQKISTFMSMFDDNEWTLDNIVEDFFKVAKERVEKENNNNVN